MVDRTDIAYPPGNLNVRRSEMHYTWARKIFHHKLCPREPHHGVRASDRRISKCYANPRPHAQAPPSSVQAIELVTFSPVPRCSQSFGIRQKYPFLTRQLSTSPSAEPHCLGPLRRHPYRRMTPKPTKYWPTMRIHPLKATLR